MMYKKKYNEKVELVNEMLEMYNTRHEEKGWNENDTFDVACWFFDKVVSGLCKADIIPKEELHFRIKKKISEQVDYVFENLK